MHWQDRPKDMTRILDRLDEIEDAVPGLKGRLDRNRVAALGHSFGGHTVSMLLGMTNKDPRSGSVVTAQDRRIKAGILFGGMGSGGSSMSENGQKMVPFHNPDFSHMDTAALVIAGDEDASPHLTSRGAEWHKDPYVLSPGPKTLLEIKGGKHGFGGVSGWDAKECDDEDPNRLAMVLSMTLAYLRRELKEEKSAWEDACKALDGLTELGSISHKAQ